MASITFTARDFALSARAQADKARAEAVRNRRDLVGAAEFAAATGAPRATEALIRLNVNFKSGE